MAKRGKFQVDASLISIDDAIGDGYHNYGFDYNNLIRVNRACHSERENRRKWASVRITTARGDVIDIDASPRRLSVRINGQLAEAKAKGGTNGEA